MQNIINNNKNLLDHGEYFELVLKEFERVILQSDLPILEVGTNMGGSSKCFLEVLIKNNKNNYLIGVDPYGAIPYHNGAHMQDSSQYENKRYYGSMKLLYSFVEENNLNYTHFKVSSDDFMSFIYPSLSLYKDSKTEKLQLFSFIYLDGSHDPAIVQREIEFFKNKIDNKGMIIVDDWEDHRHKDFIHNFPQNNTQFCLDRSIARKIIIKHNG